jgi:WD40 repeat protein
MGPHRSRHRLLRRILPLLWIFLALPLSAGLSADAWDDQPCTLGPLAVTVDKRRFSLTEQQEIDLGDAIAAHAERSFLVVNDDTNQHLQAIADRILRQLPATGLKFRFTLINLPEVNAFALPGGRVYVARKMVAFTRSEDELAGVIGHEIGHVISRQIAADVSARFRQVLGIDSFGDRKDVFDKYQRLVEAPVDAEGNRRREERHQFDADRIALLAVARAGYSPAAYAELWDRYTEAEHKTGNFLMDLVGETRPEMKRLREMLHSMSALPPECRAARSVEADNAFTEWRERVIANTRSLTGDALHGVISQSKLEPPLRWSTNILKFSADGRYVLAQVDATIAVLSREPFAVLFTIEADDAFPAQFTPDSKAVVFHTLGLRVERWDVASRVRTGAFELVVRQGCTQTALSPNGALLACIDGDTSMFLIDVETGAPVFTKTQAFWLGRGLVMPWLGDYAEYIHASWYRMAFSPDGRYFVASDFTKTVLVVDVPAKTEAKVPEAVRRAFRQSFAFVGNDKVATVNREQPDKSELIRFPSGESIRTLTLGGRVSSVTHGDYVVLRPIKGWSVGVVDLAQGKIVFASNSDAFDVYDQFQVAERLNGEIGLYPIGSTRPTSVASLPNASIGRLAARDVSPDLRWMAMSGRDRGGVWNLETGARLAHVRGFAGAYLAGEGVLLADYPKHTQVADGTVVDREREVVRLELGTNRATGSGPVDDKDNFLWQENRYLMMLRPATKNEWERDVTLDVRDIASRNMLWTRRFDQEPPRWYVDTDNGRMIVSWPMSATAAKQEIKSDARLRAAADDKHRDADTYLQVLDLTDGRVLGQVLINTGKDARRVVNVTSSGDAVVVSDRQNKVTVYSLATGERRGAAFGRFAVASGPARLLCVQNNTGVLEFLDLDSMEHKDGMKLPAGVRIARFSADGRRLLLVTADQMARVIDTTAVGASSAAR